MEALLYARTQLDDATSHRSQSAFRRRTGFRPEDLAGKLVLDVGHGMGRFAEKGTRWGAHVVGIDLASEVAAKTRRTGTPSSFRRMCFNSLCLREAISFTALECCPTLLIAQGGQRSAEAAEAGRPHRVWLYSSYTLGIV